MPMRKTMRAFFMLALSSMLFFGVNPTAAQQMLVPGLVEDGTISPDQLAEFFVYEGIAGQELKLTISSGEAGAVAAVITDADGNLVAQGVDELGGGALIVENIGLEATESYFITVLPADGASIEATIDFTISLAIESGPIAAEGEETEATEEAIVEATETAPEVAAEEPTPTVEFADGVEPTEETVVQSPATAVPTTAPPAIPTDFGIADVLTAGGIQIALTWNTTSDLDLEIRDPRGASLYWTTPTTFEGGTIGGAVGGAENVQGVNVNGACETFSADSPTEAASWAPGAVPAGSYEILVYYQQDCEGIGEVPFTITTLVDSTPVGPIQGTLQPGGVFITSFSIDANGNVTTRESGRYSGFFAGSPPELISTAQTIAVDSSVTGAVTSQQPFVAYSFPATTGDIITATMTANDGSLDPLLALLDPSGNLVEINDDDDFTGTLNSALRNVQIPTDGTYTLVASRYGQNVGGTEGNFTLALNGQATVTADTSILDQLLLPQGIIEVSLQWPTSADLQLLVRDPAGDAVFDDVPSIISGGVLGADGNVGCRAPSQVPSVSYIYWPEGTRLRPGTYEIDVWFQDSCGDTSPVTADLAVEIQNTTIVADSFNPLPNDHYITTFTIGVDGAVTRGPGGIAGGVETINFQQDLATAPVLNPGIPVSGSISDDNRFDVYVFQGTAGQVVSLRMQANAGTLDTLLFLVSPTGIELAANDDSEPGVTTDSLINEFTLPSDGQYIVIATHYGTVFGGTNGVYDLTFSRLN